MREIPINFMTSNAVILCSHLAHAFPSYPISSYPINSLYLTCAAKRAIDQGTRLAAVIEDAKTGDVFEAPVAQNYKIMKFVQSIVG